jgi:ribonuclease HI
VGKITIYFDGACEPFNPAGTASFGWVIKDEGKIVAQEGGIIGSGNGMTNNVGEYTGLIKALEALQSLDIKSGKISIFGDSSLVCKMVSKEWGWNNKKTKWIPHEDAPHLKKLLDRALGLLENYEFEINWIPRQENYEADELSKRPLVEAGIIKPETEGEKCPKCNGKLVKRKGPFGEFQGCSNYPKCRFIKRG